MKNSFIVRRKISGKRLDMKKLSLAFVIAIAFYSEKLDLLQIAGYSVILVSVVIFNLPEKVKPWPVG